MAIAGKVSIVPRGEWQSTEVYTRLDLVTFNYNVYLALKESVGTEPTNEEYFMLLIENVVAGNLEDLQNQIDEIILGEIPVGNSENSNSLGNQPSNYYATAQSVEDIVSGATSVGNAKKLGGLTAEAFVLLENAQKNGLFEPLSKKWDDIEKNTHLTTTFFTGWTENPDLPTTYGSGVILPTLDIARKFILYVGQELNLPETIYIAYMTFSDETTYTIDWKDIRNDIDAKTLNGLTAEEFVNNGNMLINTDFSNPVNTNGLTEYNYESEKICIDGWYINENAIVTLGNDGISVTHKGESAEQIGYFYQRIYNLDYYAGKTFTLSVKANGVIYSETVTFPDNIADNGIIFDSYGMHLSLNKSFFDLYKYSTWGYMEARYIVDKSYTNTVTIEWVKLELGSIATPFIPPNKEVEKLKCGATDFRKKTETVITTLPTPPTEEGDYQVHEGDDTFPYTFGHLSIRIGALSYPQEWIATYKTTGDDVQIYYNFYHATDGWKGWRNVSDGGNANTVDGYHASDFAVYKTIYYTELDNIIDSGLYRTIGEYANDHVRLVVHIKYNLEYMVQILNLFPNTSRLYFRVKLSGKWSDFRILSNITDLDNYLPLDGSKSLTKSLLFQLAESSFEISPTKIQTQLVASGTSASKFRVISIVTHDYTANDNNALKFGTYDGTVYNDYYVLHTGNSKPTHISATAPTDTSALWYDTTNKVCKYYKDGAWQQ